MKPKPIKSAFGAFFREQIGYPPPLAGESYHKAKAEVESLKCKLAELNRLIRLQDDYDIKRQYALYAWCARDKK